VEVRIVEFVDINTAIKGPVRSWWRDVLAFRLRIPRKRKERRFTILEELEQPSSSIEREGRPHSVKQGSESARELFKGVVLPCKGRD